MDELTFEIFYRKTARQLWLYVHRVSLDPALTDDILQEAYFRLLRAPLKSMDDAQTRSYLYRIATNLLKDHWRKQKREQKTLAENDRQAFVTVDHAQRQDIEAAFEKLNQNERSLLWLAYVEGILHREIAQILNLSERSIRVLLFRARRKMAGILRKEDRDT
ncbi:MAG TPA: RNA polymerase sigma factor [Pyrinomonadaceae bacterium]|jgi:RNA polymerase sigma-70 factor (ECF subfamily)|nr:RNA polymerase sigma factor [Pyrinomonadaceae bacterium]